jgi:hypothetical protein
MTQTHTVQFVHRLNEDGTIDSICRDCFATIATEVSESVLEREERKHRCESWLLERYKKRRHSENFA